MDSVFRFRRVSVGFLALCAMGFFTQLHAQFETAAVLGTITDPSGGAVQEAHVVLRNLATGTTQDAQTDSDGNYQFLDVRVGRYQVTSDATGFNKVETAEFQVTVGARQRVNVQLQVGDLKEVVSVTEAAAAIETDTSERGQVINREQILNLPLNGRSSASLALQVPGVRNAY